MHRDLLERRLLHRPLERVGAPPDRADGDAHRERESGERADGADLDEADEVRRGGARDAADAATEVHVRAAAHRARREGRDEQRERARRDRHRDGDHDEQDLDLGEEGPKFGEEEGERGAVGRARPQYSAHREADDCAEDGEADERAAHALERARRELGALDGAPDREREGKIGADEGHNDPRGPQRLYSAHRVYHQVAD